MTMQWPRGRYNGQRIIGVSVKATIRVDNVYWLPSWYKYTNCFRWLWLFVWVEAVYEDRLPQRMKPRTLSAAEIEEIESAAG